MLRCYLALRAARGLDDVPRARGFGLACAFGGPDAFAQNCTTTDCGIPSDALKKEQHLEAAPHNDVRAACTYDGCPEYSGYYCPSNNRCYHGLRDVPQSCRGQVLTCY